MIVQPRPLAVHAASLYITPEDKHAIRVPMVGAAIPVFLGGAPELAHGYDHDVPHTVAHVLKNRRHRRRQTAQQSRRSPLCFAFIAVIAPAATIEKHNFPPDIRLDHLSDLLQTLPDG